MKTIEIKSGSSIGTISSTDTLYLQRQGSSRILRGGFNGIYVETSMQNGKLRGKVSMTPRLPCGRLADEPITKSAVYKIDIPAAEGKTDFSSDFENDVLNFIELHTGHRFLSVSPYVTGYKYNGAVQNSYLAHVVSDIFFSPLRYDSATGNVIAIDHENPVAAISNLERTCFDQHQIEILVNEESQYFETLQKAKRIGFHSCDQLMGTNHCARRFTWLAGALFLESVPKAMVNVFVVAGDMETLADI